MQDTNSCYSYKHILNSKTGLESNWVVWFVGVTSVGLPNICSSLWSISLCHRCRHRFFACITNTSISIFLLLSNFSMCTTQSRNYQHIKIWYVNLHIAAAANPSVLRHGTWLIPSFTRRKTLTNTIMLFCETMYLYQVPWPNTLSLVTYWIRHLKTKISNHHNILPIVVYYSIPLSIYLRIQIKLVAITANTTPISCWILNQRS